MNDEGQLGTGLKVRPGKNSTTISRCRDARAAPKRGIEKGDPLRKEEHLGTKGL